MKDLITCITVSIDGFSAENPQFIRDSGSYQKVIDTAREMRQWGVPLRLIATIHRKNYQNINNYIDLSHEMHIPIAFSILTCSPKIEPLSEYILSSDEFSSLLTSNAEYSTQFIDTPSDNSTIYYKDRCGAGGSLISIDASGNVFPCHMLHYDEFKLGNALEAPLSSLLSSEPAEKFRNITVDDYEECSQCNYKYLCGAGCKARRFLHEGSLMGKDIYCKGYLSKLEQFGKYLASQ